MKTIYIASDHGGFKTKNKLVTFLTKKNYLVKDLGPYQLNPNDDYPDYAISLAKEVVKSRFLGILLCRNGQGVCITANKIKGARAVTGFSKKMIKSTRLDDNANILCIPSDYLSMLTIKKIVTTWLQTPFSKEKRHLRRLNKIKKVE